VRLWSVGAWQYWNALYFAGATGAFGGAGNEFEPDGLNLLPADITDAVAFTLWQRMQGVVDSFLNKLLTLIQTAIRESVNQWSR
jgi:hypothetical protein